MNLFKRKSISHIKQASTSKNINTTQVNKYPNNCDDIIHTNENPSNCADIFQINDIPNNFDDINQITKNLKYNVNIHKYNIVSSTNTLLIDMASKGATEGTIIIADSQTNGRGRMGKNFYSPSGTGLYLSILLKPNLPASQSLYLTVSAAVAVARAIESVTHHNAQIKWVNDIYIENKKVCGILAESSFNSTTGKLDYVIVGIGINLTKPEAGFPDDISNIAGAIFDTDTFTESNKNLLISNLINNFMLLYEDLNNKTFINEYIARSMIIGKNICITSENQTINATALEINDDCQLKVRHPDNSEQWLSYGDVSIRINQ